MTTANDTATTMEPTTEPQDGSKAVSELLTLLNIEPGLLLQLGRWENIFQLLESLKSSSSSSTPVTPFSPSNPTRLITGKILTLLTSLTLTHFL